MLSGKLVSVIIPVYNVEAYLKACLESVKQQSYKNFEVIVVNDGSTDGCADICNEYERIDSRFITVHKENGGVATARNNGLKIAKGEYVIFIDSDDTIDSDYIETMVSEIENKGVDFVRVPFRRNGNVLSNFSYYKTNQVIEFHSMKNLSLLASACGVMIKRSCIGNITFDKDVFYGEDSLFMLHVYLNSPKKSFILLSKPFYNYTNRGDSAVNTSFNAKWLSLLDVAEKSAKLLEQYPFMEGAIGTYKKFCYSKVLEKIIACKDPRYKDKLKSIRKEVINLRKKGYRPHGFKANVFELLTLYGGYRIIRLAQRIKAFIKNLLIMDKT